MVVLEYVFETLESLVSESIAIETIETTEVETDEGFAVLEETEDQLAAHVINIVGGQSQLDQIGHVLQSLAQDAHSTVSEAVLAQIHFYQLIILS